MGKETQPRLKIRRAAGAWVRQQYLIRALCVAGAMLAAAGCAFGIILASWVAPDWPPLAVVAAVVVLVTAMFGALASRWLRKWEKGIVGEAATGSAIDYALMTGNCAVAHTVIAVPGTRGDIDHLVATPERLWVVETKYARVPRKEFNAVVSRLVDNATAVRAWAGPEVAVQGCLVLATGEAFYKREYEDGRVVVHDPKSLMNALRREATGTPWPGAGQLARRVWELAGVEARPAP